jgi:hypothetical protein
MPSVLPKLRRINRRRKLAFLGRFLRDSPASSLLLVGSGGPGNSFEGMIERGLAAQVPWVVASDIRFVRDSLWPFVVCDARRLPFRDNAFDLVVANALIEHVGDEEDQALVVREHERVGYRWVITTPNRWFPIEAHTGAVVWHYRSSWRHRRRAIFTRILSRREFARLLPSTATVRGRWFSPTFMAISHPVGRSPVSTPFSDGRSIQHARDHHHDRRLEGY